MQLPFCSFNDGPRELVNAEVRSIESAETKELMRVSSKTVQLYT